MPSITVLRRIAREEDLGRAVEAAAKDLDGARSAAMRVVDELGGRAGIEALVVRVEREMGRPERDRIEAQALDWLVRNVEAGVQALQRWIEASASAPGLICGHSDGEYAGAGSTRRPDPRSGRVR